MERRTRSHHVGLPPTCLYLDDVERIVEIMKMVSSCVTIETRDYVVEDVAELPKIGESSISELLVEAHSPHIIVDLTPSAGYLAIADDKPAERGALEQIQSLLARRQRTAFKHLTGIPGLIAVLAAQLVLQYFIASSLYRTSLTLAASFILPLFLFTVVSVYKLGFYRSTHYSVVVLKRRIEAPSFFQRNGEKILLNLISAAIGGAVGYLVGLLRN